MDCHPALLTLSPDQREGTIDDCVPTLLAMLDGIGFEDTDVLVCEKCFSVHTICKAECPIMWASKQQSRIASELFVTFGLYKNMHENRKQNLKTLACSHKKPNQIGVEMKGFGSQIAEILTKGLRLESFNAIKRLLCGTCLSKNNNSHCGLERECEYTCLPAGHKDRLADYRKR